MSNLRFAAPIERRVAIVTGGARGIGGAAAIRLAEAGRDIVIADVSEGAETAQAIEALGQRVLFRQTDVTDEADVQALVAETLAAFGRLDILVCCAGLFAPEQLFLDQPSSEFERVMKVNVNGVYYCHKAAVPPMLQQGWGRCVTVTSGARLGSPMQVPYCTSKGAVYSLVLSMGKGFAKQGVFINGVEPGRVLTQMVIPRFSAEHLASPPGSLIGRYADAEELAEVIEFLCSERNTYTSGMVWEMKA